MKIFTGGPFEETKRDVVPVGHAINPIPPPLLFLTQRAKKDREKRSAERKKETSGPVIHQTRRKKYSRLVSNVGASGIIFKFSFSRARARRRKKNEREEDNSRA